MVKEFIDEDELRRQLRVIVNETSQVETARAIGVSDSYICEILKGNRTVGPKVAEFLGYRGEKLFEKIA
jgi:plasmid maintenance system antidote protein VapI